MDVKVQWLDDLCFVGSTEDGHSVVMDGALVEGGKKGVSPLAMLLLGVGGCASINVMTIARKQQQKVYNCVCHITSERAKVVPHVFTQIHLHFEISGYQLDKIAIGRAVQLSADKYCSAAIMLGKAVEISHDFECIEVAPI
ncbi:OsmC family protein [Neisseriaceae bacterium ESL0693]|nr:OsmC family protein [Neisseriaceae bacterium ESL0693]